MKDLEKIRLDRTGRTVAWKKTLFSQTFVTVTLPLPSSTSGTHKTARVQTKTTHTKPQAPQSQQRHHLSLHPQESPKQPPNDPKQTVDEAEAIYG